MKTSVLPNENLHPVVNAISFCQWLKQILYLFNSSYIVRKQTKHLLLTMYYLKIDLSNNEIFKNQFKQTTISKKN